MDGEGICGFDVQSGDAGKDDEFPRYVETVEVVARVGLGVAGDFGGGYYRAPVWGGSAGGDGGEGVE